jgi:hypothetical protein
MRQRLLILIIPIRHYGTRRSHAFIFYGASNRKSAVATRPSSVTMTDAFQSFLPLEQRTITPLPR